MDTLILQSEMQALADMLWAEYTRLFNKLEGYKVPQIIICNRLTATAGYNVSENNTITLGGKFFTNNDFYMRYVILPHEMAHQIDYNIYGWKKYKRHHGKCWVYIMETIGQIPDPYHEMVI